MAEGYYALSGICPCVDKTHKYMILRRKIPLLLHGQSHFPSENEEEYHLNKTRLIVTRAFDSERTPQDAFVRAILNSDKYEKNLHVSGRESIIKTEGLVCNQPDSHDEGRNR